MHQLATVVGPSALALKQMTIDHEGTDNLYVRIVGRKSGLIDWILSLLKIDTTTIFEVYGDHIKFTEGNLSGRTTTIIPLSAVSSSTSGFFKPIVYLIIGIPLIALYGLGLIFIIMYFLHKALLVSTQSYSGSIAAIAFKRSVIEGVRISQEQAEEVIEIINQLTLEAQKK